MSFDSSTNIVRRANYYVIPIAIHMDDQSFCVHLNECVQNNRSRSFAPQIRFNENNALFANQ